MPPCDLQGALPGTAFQHFSSSLLSRLARGSGSGSSGRSRGNFLTRFKVTRAAQNPHIKNILVRLFALGPFLGGCIADLTEQS